MSKKARITSICIILVLSIIAFLIYNNVCESMNREKTNITVLCSENTKSLFKELYDRKGEIHDYYNYEFSSKKSSDIVLSDDFNHINTDSEYSTVGFSPLVICFKNTENLNKYLKNNENGFLICNNSDRIYNNHNDNVSCDFVQIINAIINGKNWSSLGGDNKKITVYCPPRETVEGNLFYQFLLITLNDGKYPNSNLKEISQKANNFYNSPNVIQVDVSSKIRKLGNSINADDIYCIFESDLVSIAYDNNDIFVSYPIITVSKQIYLQFNKPEIESDITNAFNKDLMWSRSLEYTLYWKNYCRTNLNPDWTNMRNSSYTLKLNVVDGYNEYELNK